MISVSGKSWVQQRVNKNLIEKTKQDYGFSYTLSQLIISRNYDISEIYFPRYSLGIWLKEKFSLLNKKILVNNLPKRQGEMKITYGSNKKLLKFINFKKFMPFKDGLRETINWYKNFKYKKLLELHK